MRRDYQGLKLEALTNEGPIFVAALRGCSGRQRFAVPEVGARR